MTEEIKKVENYDMIMAHNLEELDEKIKENQEKNQKRYLSMQILFDNGKNMWRAFILYNYTDVNITHVGGYLVHNGRVPVFNH